MTATTPSSAPADASPAKPLPITRVYTKPGIHPYDTITWERRDVIQTNWKTGDIIFEQHGVEFPDFWSENASTIAVTKYFRGAHGTPEREWSLKQLIDRIADTYTTAAQEHGYITNPEHVEIFNHELKHMLVHQVFAFNSPVWFNVGTASPQQVSACFILAVDDTMDSILNWYKEEGTIFKGGSGAGVNLSRIRSRKELLRSSGGTASGPVSFMRGADASAGTIKSGGACLAPWTLVYTEIGPVPVQELAESNREFITFGYNPVRGRMQANRSRAFISGRKQLHRLTTDKGEFVLSADHPIMLMSGGYAALGDLKPGMSIRPGNVTINALGYHRLGLHDGHKTKESIHRMVASDVLGYDIDGMEVHHKDRNPGNNNPDNLEVMTHSEYLRKHAHEDLAAGTHPLQRFHGKGNHPQIAGGRNGLSFASGNRTPECARARDAGMRRGRVYQIGQDAAARQRMLNKAYAVINNGGSIDTFDDYFTGRVNLAGRMGYSRAEQLRKIETRFGNFDAFREEVRAGNHRVISVAPLDVSDVYDVQVFNDTPEDRSENDGHNFLIISDTNNQRGYTGIQVHNTRRAAKMVVLDVDHPDVEEFIDTKAREERKIRALRDAGFDMDLGGEDITSVQYQNANNSVRVTDDFMNAVRNDDTFNLTARLDGSVVETVSARELFRKMAVAAWECADPGIQYTDTINRWHTNKATGSITASNPCSEYLSLDNSACNLASVNLMKFRNGDGSFDAVTFTKAVEFIITAMDVSVSFGEFPTKKITDTTRKFRQLGIGYANLGALLMSNGLPYDSPEGRAFAASITALMTAAAYRRSAELAGSVGAYEGYAKNAAAHGEVMGLHREYTSALAQAVAGNDVSPVGPGVVAAYPAAVPLVEAAVAEWKKATRLGKASGWRNAQVSLLAPTGTIGFLMDCDTTGIEPDFSLVKHKKLVGGGSMTFANSQVPLALTSLGYDAEQRTEIEAYVTEHGHVTGAPGLMHAHYPVFDTAMGERPISAMGHVLMMAAVQSFLSGAISKTVNLPESVTVEDIEEVYFRGWELGLKALAVYRDNCKVGQPLSDGKATNAAVPEVVERVVEKIIERPKRTRLPQRRKSITTSFTVGEVDGYLTVGEYDDGMPGEVFIKVSKQGSTLAGVMDALSMSVSIALQYGVPLETFVEKYLNMRFEPAGITNDAEVRLAQSVMDYIVRRLAVDYLPFDTRAAMGIYTTAEKMAAQATGVYAPVDEQELLHDDAIAPPLKPALVEPLPSVVEVEVPVPSRGYRMEPPICPTCGSADGMRPTGACWACSHDGTTLGCS